MFFKKDGICYWKYCSNSSNNIDVEIDQLVLPTQLCELVLKIAHQIPMVDIQNCWSNTAMVVLANCVQGCWQNVLKCLDCQEETNKSSNDSATCYKSDFCELLSMVHSQGASQVTSVSWWCVITPQDIQRVHHFIVLIYSSGRTFEDVCTYWNTQGNPTDQSSNFTSQLLKDCTACRR